LSGSLDEQRGQGARADQIMDGTEDVVDDEGVELASR
jgi:DNA-directed RNA polymerase subunit K/omega